VLEPEVEVSLPVPDDVPLDVPEVPELPVSDDELSERGLDVLELLRDFDLPERPCVDLRLLSFVESELEDGEAVDDPEPD
jgi:hypothetical protein